MRIAILGTRGNSSQLRRVRNFRGASLDATRGAWSRGHGLLPRALRFAATVGVSRRSGSKCLPTIRHKYFDTVVHTFLSAIHAVSARYDAALICNAANAPFAPILRLTGTPVAINVDGLEHKRKKWGRLGAGITVLLNTYRHFAKRDGDGRSGDSGLLPGASQRGIDDDCVRAGS